MSEFNKSYRIRTEIGKDTQIHVKLDNNYDILELMSMKIDQKNIYRFHSSNYGVIAGRVLANDAFGVPNAKISVFIGRDETNTTDDTIRDVLYPYNSTNDKDDDGIRYNLLPKEQVSNCHTIIGTFSEKQYMLDNDNILEVFDTYFKFTTRTNNAGDYMIFGVPTGTQTIHVDIDLSDIGILSQKPRDMVYKGYNIEQFENPNKFKHDTNLSSLTQVISQDNITDVIPFWGNEEENTIGITRCDINVQYKFEPTCIFMGSVVSDTNSNGISPKCIPTPGMGAMDEITTGSGTIEMIRKTFSGDVEEFQIQGTQLINGDGVWCYQIPMNLDYMMTDEYGNMVPTNNPNKGIPTRTKVRFRLSMHDMETDSANIHRCKILIPHNPNVYSDNCQDELDYQFGTTTKEDSYRDLFWNGVYSVKSYIPRIQKGSNWKNDKFTGFKRVNYHGDKTPIPYNNIRIRLPFAYTMLCVLIKTAIKLSSFLNWTFKLCGASFVGIDYEEGGKATGSFVSINGGICNENLEYLCIIPGIDVQSVAKRPNSKKASMLGGTLLKHYEDVAGDIDLEQYMDSSMNDKDSQSIDYCNSDYVPNIAKSTYGEDVNADYSVETVAEDKKKEKSDTIVTIKAKGIRVTDNIDYFIQCIELKLAQEMKVIQFDFYNDWINGLIYIPRWVRNINKKKTYLWGTFKYKSKIKACNENYHSGHRNLVQQCSLTYDAKTGSVTNEVGCHKRKMNCHKDTSVRKIYGILKSSGIIQTVETSKQQNVYYLKPYEESDSKNIRLFATDIILLGTLNECDKWGIPNTLTELQPTSYQMPPNLALTDSDMEGNEYVSNKDMSESITMSVNVNNMTANNLDIGDCYVGINPLEEDANYTEISGVDWGYNGPLQMDKTLQEYIDKFYLGIKNNEQSKIDEVFEYYGKENFKKRINFFRPGGHFLGISCRNSETTIKSCVNLSRICEQGVWMSQRQVLTVPNPDIDEKTRTYSRAFKEYATVPSGFISKDEISGTDYRRLFASMNKNRLRTTIDEKTGYPVYDFKYVNPTNFAGDLSAYVFNKSIGVDMNRTIVNGNDGVEEHYYEYIDDNYVQRGKSVIKRTVNETQIMRTGEYRDNEYIKYRFGYTDKSFVDTGEIKPSEIKKRFLHHAKKTNTTTNTIEETVSFPIYDNSYYFYFGLRDGKTALDEFKKTYYAVCEKTNNLIDTDNKINFIGIKSKFDGLDTEKPHGEFIFTIDTNKYVYGIDNVLYVRVKAENFTDYPAKYVDGYGIVTETNKHNIGYLKGEITYSENDVKWVVKNSVKNSDIDSDNDHLEINPAQKTIKIESLFAGDYTIEIESREGVYATLNFTIKRENVSGNILSDNFTYHLSDTSINDFYTGTGKPNTGGYIYIDENMLLVESDNLLKDDETTSAEVPVFKETEPDINNFIKCIKILFTKKNNNNVEDEIVITHDINDKTTFKFIFNGKEHTCNVIPENGFYKIPVPYANIEYTVFIETYLDENYKLNNGTQPSNSVASWTWKIGSATILCAPPLSVLYNNIPIEIIMGYAQPSEKTTFNGGSKVTSTDINYFSSFRSEYGWWNNDDLYNNDNDSILWRIKENLFCDTEDGDNPHSVKISISGGAPPYTVDVFTEDEEGRWKQADYTNITCATINNPFPDNCKSSNIGIKVTDRHFISIPTDKYFVFPAIYKPFFAQTLLMSIDLGNNETGYYMYGHIYNGKTYNKTYAFNDISINRIVHNNVVSFPNNWRDDYTLKVDELDHDKFFGGGGYFSPVNGIHSKYNARKAVLNGKIASDMVNLSDDKSITYVNLKIGSDYTNGGVSYSDYTKIARNDISFTKFVIDYEAAKEIDGKKEDDCFKVSVRPNFEDNKYIEENYTLFYVIYNNYHTNAPSGYDGVIKYPYNSGTKTIDSNMCNIILRKLVNIYESKNDYENKYELDKVKHMYCLNNYYKLKDGKTDNLKTVSDDEIDEKTGKVYYKISTGENNDVDWRIYFIAVPKHFIKKEYPTDGVEETTNKHNMMLPISISQLIDINQVYKFLPLRITGVQLKYTIGNYDRFTGSYDPDYKSLELFVMNELDANKENTKLEKQQITFHIYYKPIDSSNAEFLCDITQTMLDDYKDTRITQFDLDVEKYISILLPGYNEDIHGNTTGTYTGGLCYTYDTKKDGFSSPITFTDPENIYYKLNVQIINYNTGQSTIK